jgi:hypothetical protein
VSKEQQIKAETVKPVMEVLGCEMTANVSRKATKKEEKRVEEAEKAVRLVATLPLAYQAKIVAVKALGLSKATYGWVAKSMDETKAQRLFNAVLRTLKGAWTRRANRHLKAMILGGTLHLSSVTVQRLTNLLQTMCWRRHEEDNNRRVQWNSNQCGIVTNVRRQLKRMGWQETERPFVWKLEGDNLNADMIIDMTKNVETEKERKKET